MDWVRIHVVIGGLGQMPNIRPKESIESRTLMSKMLTMVYWKSDKFWLGKLIEYPEIMTQGESIEELEENLRDAYLMMVMEDVPEGYEIKEISVSSAASSSVNSRMPAAFFTATGRAMTFTSIR